MKTLQGIHTKFNAIANENFLILNFSSEFKRKNNGCSKYLLEIMN